MASDAASVCTSVSAGGVATAAAMETGAVVIAPLADVVVVRDVGALLPVEVEPPEVDPPLVEPLLVEPLLVLPPEVAGGDACGWDGDATGVGVVVSDGTGVGVSVGAVDGSVPGVESTGGVLSWGSVVLTSPPEDSSQSAVPPPAVHSSTVTTPSPDVSRLA